MTRRSRTRRILGELSKHQLKKKAGVNPALFPCEQLLSHAHTTHVVPGTTGNDLLFLLLSLLFFG